MKIKFISDAIVMVEGKPEALFEQGDIQDLNPASAERWKRRGIAVDHAEQPSTEIRPKAKKAK